MQNQKHLFSLNPDIHYLNCAYKAPLLKAAEEACIRALIKERNPADIGVNDFFDNLETVKTNFGSIVNCNPQNVAVMPSSSYGFASVLNNIDGKQNGNAVTIKDEFPSGYFALEKWCKQHYNKLEVIQPEGTGQLGENWNNRILDAIDNKTSVVLLSSVHWMSGLKFNLKAIGEKCKQVGAKLIVDGTQSVGALPIDVNSLGIDALICAAYKWLFGPYSTALAYISDEFQYGSPIEESWMNRGNAHVFSELTNYDSSYQPRAARYNVGQTSNFILMPILKTGLKQIIEWRPENIQAYCKQLIKPLLTYLDEIGGMVEAERYFSNHLFALKLPKSVDLALLKAIFEERQIIISLRGENLRIAINVFNTEEDIQQLVSAIESARR